MKKSFKPRRFSLVLTSCLFLIAACERSAERPERPAPGVMVSKGEPIDTTFPMHESRQAEYEAWKRDVKGIG